MLQAAVALPCSAEQAAVGSLLPGYVASVTQDSVFVRFLGNLTGRAGQALLPLARLPKCSRPTVMLTAICCWRSSGHPDGPVRCPGGAHRR